MGGSPVALSELIVFTQAVLLALPKGFTYVASLIKLHHSLSWRQPVHLPCSNDGGESGHISLTLFFSFLKQVQGAVARLWYREGCWVKGRWEQVVKA